MAQSKEKLEWKKQRETKEKELKEVPIQLKWFSWSGITTEIKRIRWIKFGELMESTGKVLVFCILSAFSSYYVISLFLSYCYL